MRQGYARSRLKHISCKCWWSENQAILLQPIEAEKASDSIPPNIAVLGLGTCLHVRGWGGEFLGGKRMHT